MATLVLTASAAQAATGGDIRQRIDTFVGSEATAVVDARLNFAACSQQPTIEWYGALGKALVVTCAAKPGWRFFVPVRAAGKSPTLVPAFTPPVVKRGDPVLIHAGGSGFRITAEGVAEQDGRVGAHIRVRNSGTGGTLRAVVESGGNVFLPGYSSGSTGR